MVKSYSRITMCSSHSTSTPQNFNPVDFAFAQSTVNNNYYCRLIKTAPIILTINVKKKVKPSRIGDDL